MHGRKERMSKSVEAKRLGEMAYGFWPGVGHRPRRRDAPAVVEALRCCVLDV